VKKIAPTLRDIVNLDGKHGPGSRTFTIGETKVAMAELRALLAVARAARGVEAEALRVGGGSRPVHDLIRALSRLDRASGKERGTK
jgi:hypothetical protein